MTPDEFITSVTPPITPRAKKVIALAAKAAREYKHEYVGAEHLLIGILREGEGHCAQWLASHGVKESDLVDHLRML